MPADMLLNIGLFALLAVVIVFMFRNSRKRRRDAEDMQARLLPGAEVMTQHGIYGTLVSMDLEKNEAVIETTPGTQIRLHSQTIAKVVDPTDESVVEDDADETVVPDDASSLTAEPEFGERTDRDGTDPKKPGKSDTAE